jgi:type II secretory pathway pseudopilin PulG
MRPMSTKNQRGFTLVEVAIISPVMILIAISIVAILITLVSSTIQPNTRSLIMQQEEKAFESIENDINNSAGLLSSLPANFSDGSASDYASPPSGTTVIRVQTYDQIINPNDSSGTKIIPAFKDSATCSNITDLGPSNIVPVVAVYFVRDNTLFRRTLTDTTVPATCGTKLAKQTCQSSEDIALVRVDNLSAFSVVYYTGITNDVVTTDPTVAKSARITITAASEAAGDTIQYTSSLRAARLND